MATKITLTFFLFSIPFFAHAYTIIPFWQEDFGGGQLPSGWSVEDPTNNAVFWQHCNGFNDCPLEVLSSLGLFPDERFQSTSMENGFAYLFPFGEGGGIEEHHSILETQSIDCSNKPQVFLAFSTFIMTKNSDPETAAVLEVRNSNSPVWVPFTIFPFLTQDLVQPERFFPEPDQHRIQSYNGQYVCLDISSVAAGQKEVFVRWRWDWTGDQEYCWLIDDIELLDKNPLHENAVWGIQSGEGDFDGGLNGWAVPPLATCNWVWSANGLVDYPDSDDRADGKGCSCTLKNGVAMMNGVCSASLQDHYAELISPTIDLSGATSGKRLGLRFNQAGAIGNNSGNSLPVTSVMVSTDGGQNFTDTIFLNLVEPFRKSFCKNTLLPLPATINGTGEFVFKFVFSGSSFYWVIDDVRVVELFDYDLKISEDYYSVAPNYSTPPGLVRPIGFAAEVQNRGSLAQDFVKLYAEVFDDFSMDMVFRDTLFLGVLEPGAYSSDTFFSKKFLPLPHRAYTVFYTVEGDGFEEYEKDNRVVFRFNTQSATYSKNSGRYSINGGFTPVSNDLRYEIGNCFYMPPGSDATALSMQFAISNGRQMYEFDDDVSFGINLYQWQNGDANGDFLANLDEYEKIAETIYQLEADLLPWEVITVPFPDPVPLEAGAYYFVTVNYFSPASANFQQMPFFIASSEEINYSSVYYQSLEGGQPAFTSMLRLWGESDFEANAWGLLRIPYLNLNVEPTTPSIDVFAEEDFVSLFPNPTAGQLNIEFLNDKITNGTAIEIYDICGQLALPRQNLTGYVSQIPIDVSQLRSGMYNLRVTSRHKAISKKFVVASY